MQYRTHITVSLAVGLPMLAAVDQVTFINTVALVCGSVLPISIIQGHLSVSGVKLLVKWPIKH